MQKQRTFTREETIAMLQLCLATGAVIYTLDQREEVIEGFRMWWAGDGSAIEGMQDFVRAPGQLKFRVRRFKAHSTRTYANGVHWTPDNGIPQDEVRTAKGIERRLRKKKTK